MSKQSIHNPFSGEEEIVFKDTDGKMKTLVSGQVQEVGVKNQVPPPVSETPPTKPEREHTQVASSINYDPAIDVIVSKLQLDVMDPVLSKRLRNIILSRLKGIRNDIEIQESLTRDVKVGGMGIDADKGENVVRIIKESAQKPNFTSDAAMNDDKDVPPPKQEQAPKPEPKTEQITEPKPQPKPEQKQEPQHKQSSKKEDVKIKSQLVGPVEELQHMSIVDFRRLDSNPEKATEKIMEKIKLLAKESFEKKLLGIEAWRHSEIFKVYTELGSESLEKKMPMKEIIKLKEQEGKPFLNEGEFDSIMDFNQKLRF